MKWMLGALGLLAVLLLAQFLSWVRYRDELEEAASALSKVKAQLVDLEMRLAEESAHRTSESEILQLELELLRHEFEAIARGAPSTTGESPQDTSAAASLPRFHDVDRTTLPRPPLPFVRYDDLAPHEQGLLPGYPAAIYRHGRSILQYVVLMRFDGTYSYDDRELQLGLDLLEATRESEGYLALRLRESIQTDGRVERWSTFDEALDSASLRDSSYRAFAASDDEAFVFPASVLEGDSRWAELEAAKRALADELQRSVANVIVGSSVIPPAE